MIEIIKELIDFILHLDVHLQELIKDYGVWTYAILFLIIFVETGLVIMPFLPGDSLLFAAGAFAANGSFNVFYLIIILFVAAVLGDTVNYHIGKLSGEAGINSKWGRRLIKPKHLEKTHLFYEKYGGKTIIFARFVPIVRTLAPFVAGVGVMSYKKFLLYNVTGGAVWVVSLISAGYLFADVPIVKNNFTYVIFAIIILSLLPPVIEVIRYKLKKKPDSV